MKKSKIFLVVFAIVGLLVQQTVADDDSYKLKLSVAVTSEYIVIGARGGFLPNVYYRILNGRYSNRYAAIQKESEEDPGRVIWALYSSWNDKPDSAYVDGSNSFLALPGEGSLGERVPENLRKPRAGIILATISPNSARTLRPLEAERAVVAPLSAFDVIAKDLFAIHSQFIDMEDADDATLIIDESFYRCDKLHVYELRPLMRALKDAGFRNIRLSVLGGDEDFRFKAAYEELYFPLGLGYPKRAAISSPQTKGVLKILEAQAKRDPAAAYDSTKNQKFTKDIDQVLKEVAGLQTTGKTDLGGRRGSADGGFNEGYAEGGSGGLGDGLAGLLGGGEGGGGGIATKAKGSIRTPSESDIDVEGFSRSSADIMKVVRQRIPGLRHIYNKFLKNRPGFQGRVTLKFTIAPGGEIISISIASSTTGYGEFDGEIKTSVSRWKFSKVKSGNTTVKIPFTFSED